MDGEKREAFKPILLDFTGCRFLGEIHLILKEKFGFPEYYGENWDALWDCMQGLFFKRGPFQVQIKGFLSLPEDLRKYCETMLKIFDEIHNENPNVVFEFVS